MHYTLCNSLFIICYTLCNDFFEATQSDWSDHHDAREHFYYYYAFLPDTGHKLNVHKTLIRCLGLLLNVLCTFWFASYVQRVNRKQPPEVFHEKRVLKNFTKFTGKHLRESLFSNRVAGWRPVTLLKKSITGVFLWV